MFRALYANGRCGKLSSGKAKAGGAAHAGTGSGPVSLRFSVGRNGRNDKADVTAVQDALKRIGPAQGGQPLTFSVDGQCGAQTITAIQQFQLKHFGWSGADGLVEVGRQTHQKLNQLMGGSVKQQAPVVVPATGGGAHQAGNHPAFREALTMAQLWLRKAQADATAALAYVNRPNGPTMVPGFDRDSRMKNLNFSFRVDDTQDKERRVRFVLHTLHRMQQVFQRPGGLWGAATFEPDPAGVDDDIIAYTYMAGFYRGGQTANENGTQLRADTIYLTPVFSGFKDQQARARTIVHELAHFVGHPEEIDDHAYEWNWQAMSALDPNRRLLNADSFAKYVAECSGWFNNLG